MARRKRKVPKHGDSFVKIDLHIHTPASSCYRGSKDDEEYFRILKKAKKENLRIIAITDHNSIFGYEKLLTLKKNLQEEENHLGKLKDSVEMKNRSVEIEKKLSLFQGILILPGIEFEVRPGIHFLLIFPETVQVEQIHKLLIDGGYGPDTFGIEKPRVLSKWDTINLYEQSQKYDCMVIDAHTDSDKGIYNTIPAGLSRAKFFADQQLSAVAYRSESQREKLVKILNTAKEYSRSTPMSFVRFSDAHHFSDVGSQSTWVKLEKIDFQSLKAAFTNPKELVSTEIPSVDRILSRLIRDKTAFGLPNWSDGSLDQFRKLICALNNSMGGYVLFGVTPEMSRVGLDLNYMGRNQGKQDPKKIIDKILECFGHIEGNPESAIRITAYPLQNRKIIISVRIPPREQLLSLKGDGRIYSLKNREVYMMSGAEVQALVEQRSITRIKADIEKRIGRIERDCALVKNIFASKPIISKFNEQSKPFLRPPHVEEKIELDPSNVLKLKKSCPYGGVRGNLFLLEGEQGPRLSCAYLRYSLPLFTLRGCGLKAKDTETIYIVPGGGVFYSKRNYLFFSEAHPIILELFGKGLLRHRPKFLACFLKSSLLLWYLQNTAGGVNLFLPQVFKKIRLPIIDGNNTDHQSILQSIEEDFDKILNLEKQFLITRCKLTCEKITEHTNKHNTKVSNLAYKIDHAIYKLANLKDEEINVIESYLRLNEIYLPEETKQV